MGKAFAPVFCILMLGVCALRIAEVIYMALSSYPVPNLSIDAVDFLLDPPK